MQGDNQQKGTTIYLKRGKRIGGKKKRGPAAPLPAKAIRLDGMHHCPIFMEDGKKGPCKNPDCQQITRIYCEKFKLNLCFTAKSNCFRRFHTE